MKNTIEDVTSEFVIELWSTLRNYISAKERADAAEMFITVFDAHSLTEAIDHKDILVETMPKELKAAIKSRLAIDEELEDEDDYSGW